MRMGLALPHYDFSFPDRRPVSMARVVEYARRAEALGFDSVWVSDHLFFDIEKYGGEPGRHATPEAMTMLAAIASATERVRFGSLVLCASFRHPAVLAQQARSLHDLSAGRFDLGLGAGWYEPEFVEAGIPFGTAGQRIERLAAIAGQLDALVAEPIPVWIGGKGGPKLMRVIAENAGGWNVSWQMTPETYRERLATLDDACAAAGRDAATVRRSVGLYTLVGEDEGDVARRYEALRGWAPGGALDSISQETFGAATLLGTPEACAARIKEFEALGVEEVICSLGSLPFVVHDDEQMDLVAGSLIPLVR